MNEIGNMRPQGGVTVLRRHVTLVGAAWCAVAALASPARADVPAGVTAKQEAAVDALALAYGQIAAAFDGAGSDCAVLAKAIADDDHAEAERLLDAAATLDMDNAKISAWVDGKIRADVQAVTGSRGWKACSDDVAFGRAAAAHPLLTFLVGSPQRKAAPKLPAGLKAADAKIIVAGAKAFGALELALEGAGDNCAVAAKIIRKDTTSARRAQAAARERLQGKTSPEAAKWIAMQYVDAMSDGAVHIWTACKRNDTFMKAALAHPMLKLTAMAMDARPKARPAAVTKRVLRDVDKLLSSMQKSADLVAHADECRTAASHLAKYFATQKQLQARLTAKKLGTAGQMWLANYATPKFGEALGNLAIGREACSQDPAFKKVVASL